jgi:hypothetical protein
MDEIIESQLIAMRAQIDSLLMCFQLRRVVNEEEQIPDIEVDEDEFIHPPVFGKK